MPDSSRMFVLRRRFALVLAVGIGLGTTVAAQGNASNMGNCSRAFAQVAARPLFNDIMRGIAGPYGVPMGAVVSYIAQGEGDCRD